MTRRPVNGTASQERSETMRKPERKRDGVANPELAFALAELRRSNAAGNHLDRRTRRLRARGAAASRAIRDSADG
jgi:hypothetical protein